MKLYPPILVLIGIIVQLIIARVVEAPIKLDQIWIYIGIALVVIGFLPIPIISRAFREQETGIKPDTIPTAFLETGLFRFSRNPIYVGMSLFLIGSALIIGNLYGLLIVVLFVFAVQKMWIRKEEVNLEAQFGEAYRAYKERVRRWI
jgi:protein-S-isoprenylcysteine O-methyltransferase Ste14